MEQPKYHGSHNHSVNELEKIIEDYIEYTHKLQIKLQEIEKQKVHFSDVISVDTEPTEKLKNVLEREYTESLIEFEVEPEKAKNMIIGFVDGMEWLSTSMQNKNKEAQK